jgi:hypothetical protein
LNAKSFSVVAATLPDGSQLEEIRVRNPEAMVSLAFFRLIAIL